MGADGGTGGHDRGGGRRVRWPLRREHSPRPVPRPGRSHGILRSGHRSLSAGRGTTGLRHRIPVAHLAWVFPPRRLTSCQRTSRNTAIPTRHGRNQCPTVALIAAARAGSIVLLKDSGAVQTSTMKFRAIARSAIWTSRIRSIPIVQITLATDQAETPSRLGRYTFTAPLAHWGRAGAKCGSPRRTRKRSGNTCSISSACLRSTPTRATTSTRPAHIEALMQLLAWRDERLVPALEEIARHPEAERARADIEETIRTVEK